MSIRIFYHVAALNHWETVVRDQVGKLVFSGLYDKAAAIHCVCVGPEARRAACLLLNFGAKFRIEACDSEDTTGERITLALIHRLVSDGDRVLYLHTKGVTKIPPSECVYWWNFYMEYFLIKNHMRCLDLLETSDCVGLDYYPKSLGHFSGNMWWARADYLKTLEPPAASPERDKYHNTETWVLGGAQNKAPRIAQLAHSGNDHYLMPFYAAKYIDR